MIKLRETGPWHLLKARFEQEIPECKQPPKGKPLGIEKIFTLFGLMLLGSIFAFVLLLVELIFTPPKKANNSLSSQPLFLTTALESVNNLMQLIKGQNQDEDGILTKLTELDSALKMAFKKAKKLQRLQ